MIKMEDKICILVFSYKVSTYEMSKRTGIDAAVFSKLRKGQRDIKNLTIATGRKLEECYNECINEKLLSYDDDFSIALDHFTEMKMKQNDVKKV